MNRILSLLNEDNIKSGKAVELIPEFYELKNAIENSKDGWHQQESVFDHTLSVVSALKKIISDHKGLERILDQKIDKNTRRTLLETAAMLHDIGKRETMVVEDNFTKCIGHEQAGVEKAKTILGRLDLPKKEIDYVLDTIANHSCFHKLLMPENENFQKDSEDLRSKFNNYIYPELILLSYADTINSKLKEIGPNEFNNRINFYKKEIQNLSQD